jgi:hypothetical protein
VLDRLGLPMVREASGHPLDESEASVDQLQQEPTAVAAEAAGTEVELDTALAGLGQEELRVVCEDGLPCGHRIDLLLAAIGPPSCLK